MSASTRPAETTAHTNNFDFIRIAAALAVLFSHQHALVGRFEPAVLGIHTLGGFAVLVFFVISGYLVTASWINDPHVFRFAARRALRVWPALIAVVVLSTYALGAWTTQLPLGEYLRNAATTQYLANIWLNNQVALPGVFLNNPLPHSVNGSIWTIPFEVACYAVVAIAGLLGIFRFRTVSLVVIVLALIWYQIRLGPDLHRDWKLRREMMAYFFVGSALFLLTPHWSKRPLVWLFVTVLAGLGLWLAGFRYLALMVGLPFALIYFGTSSTPVIRRFGRFGDPSYGLYLIAFPIQQTVIQYLWPTLGFKETLFISIAITTALAYLSWHVLEKRALKIKPKKSHA